MSRAKVVRCVALLGIPSAAVCLLLMGFHDSQGAREIAPARSQAAVVHPAPPNPVHRAKDDSIPERPRGEPATFLADGEVLTRSLLALDTPNASVTDLQQLGSTLTRLLTERPELGPAAASLLARLKERNVLLQVSLALRAVVNEPMVHARLMEMATGDLSDEQREAAMRTLGGLNDPVALEAFSRIFADNSTPDLTRSQAAYQLGRDLETAPADARAAAIQTASGLIEQPGVSERVRTEAIDLLGIAGLDDRSSAVARTILADPSNGIDLALAAARALLRSGASGTDIAAALRPRVRGDPEEEAMVNLLEGNELPGMTAGH